MEQFNRDNKIKQFDGSTEEIHIPTVEELIPTMLKGSTCWWELVSPLTNIKLAGLETKNYDRWVWFYAEKQDVSGIVFDIRRQIAFLKIYERPLSVQERFKITDIEGHWFVPTKAK